MTSPSVTLGSQNVKQIVQLDTGSTELWINPDCNTAPPSEKTFCQSIPKYNPSASTTSKKLTESFDLEYVDGSYALGLYYTDDLKLGSASIKTQQFGYANKTEDMAMGILGVGLHDPAQKYPTVIENLAAQKQINSVAYSLDLRGTKDPSGSIIFGGIDTKKYQCSLEKQAIIPPASSTAYPRFAIYLKSVGQTTGSNSKTYPASVLGSSTSGLPVVLDSGSTISYLPAAAIQAIAADFPGAKLVDSTNQVYSTPCTPPAGSVDFTFGTKTIKVPYSELIRPYTGGLCRIGIQVSSLATLGDTFLRAAYAVFDVDNKNIWLDQAADCGSTLR